MVTTNTYDLRGRLLTQTTGDLTTTMTYLPTGLLSSVRQPSGYQISYQYDAAYRLIGWSDNRGNSGSYVLDAMGNRISEQIHDAQNQLAFQLSRTINIAINRIASQTVGGNQLSSYRYDANGDLTSITIGSQSTITYGLDALRRLTTEKNPLNATATLTYNALNAVTLAKDFKGVTTAYTRDAQGNATQESSADIGSQQSNYDARGLNSSSQDAAGRSQQTQRDILGRLTILNASNSTTSLDSSFNYQNGTDQLSQIQEPHVTTNYQRDNLGRVTRKSQSIEGN